MIERQHVSLNAPSACIALLTSCPSRCTRGQPWAESRASSGFAGHLPPMYERTCVCCVCVVSSRSAALRRERDAETYHGGELCGTGEEPRLEFKLHRRRKKGSDKSGLGDPDLGWIKQFQAKELQSVLLESPTPRHLCRRCICSPPSAKSAGCCPRRRTPPPSRRSRSRQSPRSCSCALRG